MANRRFEMFEYRQVLTRMWLGHTDLAIAGLMGRANVAALPNDVVLGRVLHRGTGQYRGGIAR